jgi:hypothetical protein
MIMTMTSFVAILLSALPWSTSVAGGSCPHSSSYEPPPLLSHSTCPESSAALYLPASSLVYALPTRRANSTMPRSGHCAAPSSLPAKCMGRGSEAPSPTRLQYTLYMATTLSTGCSRKVKYLRAR